MGVPEPRRPVDDLSPRPGVTLRPLVTYLIVFDFLVGLSAGILALIVAAAAGAPAGLSGVTALIAGAVSWVAAWLRTSVRFTENDLIVTLMFRPHRIPWHAVDSVTLHDVSEDHSGPVTHRRAVIRYQRHPGTPVEPFSGQLSLGRMRGYYKWEHAHYRKVTLPLFFPVDDGEPAPAHRGRLRRRADRQREAIRDEFAAHGFPFPDRPALPGTQAHGELNSS